MRRSLAALLAGMAMQAAAQEPAGAARWYLQLDNDFFFNTDRWYSSGVRIARVAPRAGYELEFGLLQEIYTPEAKRFNLGTIDRAPDARMLFSVARHDRSPGMLQTLGVDLGVRGPSAHGQEVTESIHHLVNASDVVWSRQEDDEFDAQLVAVRSHAIGAVDLHYGAVLGNQVAFAHAGAEYRFGARLGHTAVFRYAATPPDTGARGWGGFVGASVRGVARNEPLKRPYSIFGEELQRKSAVVRAGAGLGYAAASWSVALSLVQESREFDGQRTAHRFGSLTVHAGF